MAQSVRYRNSQLEYVRGKEHVLFSNGVLLNVYEFDELDKADRLVFELHRRHRNGAKLYDFRHAVQYGVLRPLGGTAKPKRRRKKAEEKPPAQQDAGMTSPHPSAASLVRPAPEASLVLSKERKVSAMVEAVMIVVAIGSAIMSAYHTSAFMHQAGRELWVSVMTGIIMIFFSSTAFTAGRYFFLERNASMVFGLIFVVLGFAIITFSMFATITVNFNQFAWAEQEQREVLIDNSVAIAAASQRSELLLSEVNRLDAEIALAQESLEHWRTTSWARYDAELSRIEDMRQQRNTAWRDYLNAGDAMWEATATVQADAGTIYSFFTSLFGASEEVLRFAVYVIPSVFYDIAAPFSVTIILLLAERRRKKK